MSPGSLTFAGGLLMGLASSLHCAGMCGAIASSLLMTFDPKAGAAGRARTHFLAQSGRMLVYILSGATLGGLGAGFYGAFDHASGYLALRWAAAVALGWIGFSVAGFAPSFAGVDRLTTPITVKLNAMRFQAGATDGGAFLSGLIWGFLPCGMVYGALFYALLAGDALGGAAVMAGFALGTLPAVTAVAFGMSGLRRLGDFGYARIAVGLSIVALAALSLIAPMASFAALCARL